MQHNRLILTLAVLFAMLVLPVQQALAHSPASSQAEPVFSQTFYSIPEHDGWVLESTENSNEGGVLNAGNSVIRVGDDAADRQFRSILSFNTSGIPDGAVIVAATLRLKKQGGEGTDPFTTHGKLLLDIRKPAFGLSALELSDFQAEAGLSPAGAVAAAPVEGYHRATLLSAAFAQINKAGLTQLRLRFQLDDNDDRAGDFLNFYSGSAAELALRPALELRYYVPAVPTATRTQTRIPEITRTRTATQEPCLPTITPTRTPPCFDCVIPPAPAAALSADCSSPTSTVTRTRTATITQNPCLPTVTPTPTTLCFDCLIPPPAILSSDCATATQTRTPTAIITEEPCVTPTITPTPTPRCFDCLIPPQIVSASRGCPPTPTAEITHTPTIEATSTPTATENTEPLTPTPTENGELLTPTPTERCFDC